jgi:hypothetical protein
LRFEVALVGHGHSTCACFSIVQSQPADRERAKETNHPIRSQGILRTAIAIAQ